jgi:hypothetical protein
MVRKVLNTKLKNGSSPGPSGWTGELLAILGTDEACLEHLAVLIRDIINGLLPNAAREYIMASVLIPVSKPDGGVRPIAVPESLYKLSALYSLELVRGSLPSIFEPIQFGVGVPGGAERALHTLQAGIECLGEDVVVLKTDFRNAFNERRRADILTVLFQHDLLRPLWRIAHWAYKQPSQLLVFDRGSLCGTISSAEGVKQGDVLGSLLFSLSCTSIINNALLMQRTFTQWRWLTT